MKQYRLAAAFVLASTEVIWAWSSPLLHKARSSRMPRVKCTPAIAATMTESNSEQSSPPGFEQAPSEAKAYGGPRWEGDATRRPLGSMERLLNARRSWDGHAMTTAHVSTAILGGPPPSPEELTTALTWVIRRHPLLASVIRGKGKYHVPNAQPYPLHGDYLGKSIEYTDELLRAYPDNDVERFEPSSLTAPEIASRALQVVQVNEAPNDVSKTNANLAASDAANTSASAPLQDAWREGMRRSMDELVVGGDSDEEGPLWRLTLYTTASKQGTTSGGGSASGGSSDRSSSSEPSPSFALGWAANHAVSDQLSFHIVLSQTLEQIALQREEALTNSVAAVNTGTAASAASRHVDTLSPPTQLPLPPSVEGALLGPEQRQGDEIKTRLELLLGSFERGRWKLPHWVRGRVNWSTIQYAIWQMVNSKAQLLPKWVPSPETLASDPNAEAIWGHQARRTANTYRSMDAASTSALLSACRKHKVTISSALCAAAALGASDVMGDDSGGGSRDSSATTAQRYKILQALDMRPFPTAKSHASSKKHNGEAKTTRPDWSQGTVLAGTGSLDLLVDLPPQAGEKCRDGNQGNLDTFWTCAQECRQQTLEWVQKGWPRESLLLFSSGWEFMNMNRVVELGSQDRATLGRPYSAGISNVGVFKHPTSYGDLNLREVYFGISQTVSAPAVSVSAATVGGKLCLMFHTATPLWPQSEAAAFADNFVRTLELAAAKELEGAASSE